MSLRPEAARVVAVCTVSLVLGCTGAMIDSSDGRGDSGASSEDAPLAVDTTAMEIAAPVDVSAVPDAGPSVDAPSTTPPDAPKDAPAIDGPAGPVAHRVLSAVSDKGVLAIVGADGRIEWQYDVLSLGGEANDAWQLANGDIAFAYRSGARQLTAAKITVWDYAAPAGTEVHSCQPLPGGHFLIGEAHDGGVGLLRELDAAGKVVSTVTVTMPGGFAPHNQFREVRKTPQGTYLVTYLQTNKAYELDGTGRILRTFACGSFVAIRLPDGNTLISCGDAHRVIEVDPQDRIVWQVNETDAPGNRLGFAAGMQRLPNGDTIICNWPGHSGLTNQPQAFQITRDKRVVWTLNSPALGWTSNADVLDADAQVGGVALR